MNEWVYREIRFKSINRCSVPFASLLYCFTLIKLFSIIVAILKKVNGGIKMFDYHVHSNFSADCETPMENTIKQAIANGYTDICFTEHIDYDYPDPTIEFELDIKRYSEKVHEMNAIYGDVIHIHKGVEIGLQPHLLSRYEKLMQEEAFDFVLCSIHTVQKQGLHSRDLFKGRTVEEAFRLYYEELLYCVQRFSNYDVLAHIDLVKRYTDKPSEDQCLDLIEEIFKIIIPQGKGIEINTSSYRYGLQAGMPSTDILELYKTCGGSTITLGSDSHVSETIGYKFDESKALLKNLGFDTIMTYENRKPTAHRI